MLDTFGTPGAARAYGRAIAQAIPEKPIRTIIYSHDHLDHAGFAADLAPDAEIIADEMCARVIEVRRAKGQQAVIFQHHVDGCRQQLLQQVVQRVAHAALRAIGTRVVLQPARHNAQSAPRWPHEQP